MIAFLGQNIKYTMYFKYCLKLISLSQLKSQVLVNNTFVYIWYLQLCPQCILRLFGKYGPIYSHYSRIYTLLSEVTGVQPSQDDPSTNGSAKEDIICSVCYGILQFIYVDEKRALVNRGCGSDFAALICELIRKEGYQADSFSLEVSIPPIILENENDIRLVVIVCHSSLVPGFSSG